MPNPTAAMLTIGDEILSGRTRDSNMPHLAGRSPPRASTCARRATVPDVAAEIVAAVNALRARYTTSSPRAASGRPTTTSPPTPSPRPSASASTCARTPGRSSPRNYANPEVDLNPARLRMARIPDGAVLIENPVSKAPGFSLGNVHVMAGVPAVFEAMVAGLLPRLTGGRPLLSETLRVMRPEGEIAGPLRLVAEAHPGVSIGSYPFNRGGVFGANLVARSDDPEALAAAAAALRALARDAGRLDAPEAARRIRGSRGRLASRLATAGCRHSRRIPARPESDPRMHGLDLVNTLIFVGVGAGAARHLLEPDRDPLRRAAAAGLPAWSACWPGRTGPGGIVFNNYRLTYLVGSVALAVILFDGGLRTRLSVFRGVLAPSLILATAGVLITAAVAGARRLGGARPRSDRGAAARRDHRLDRRGGGLLPAAHRRAPAAAPGRLDARDRVGHQRPDRGLPGASC